MLTNPLILKLDEHFYSGAPLTYQTIPDYLFEKAQEEVSIEHFNRGDHNEFEEKDFFEQMELEEFPWDHQECTIVLKIACANEGAAPTRRFEALSLALGCRLKSVKQSAL